MLKSGSWLGRKARPLQLLVWRDLGCGVEPSPAASIQRGGGINAEDPCLPGRLEEATEAPRRDVSGSRAVLDCAGWKPPEKSSAGRRCLAAHGDRRAQSQNSCDTDASTSPNKKISFSVNLNCAVPQTVTWTPSAKIPVLFSLRGHEKPPGLLDCISVL